MLLSIIIPVHNSEEFLEQCVKSIYLQEIEHSNFEVILVNNASTDDSLNICYLLSNKYENLHVLTTEVAGVSNARNMGLRAALGEYIHFVDSDDVLENGMLRAYMKEVKNDFPDLIVSGIKNYYVNTCNEILQQPKDKKKIQNVRGIEYQLKELSDEDKIWLLNVVWNKWYKRKILTNNNILFDTSLQLGEDFVFNCNFFTCINSYLELPYSYYRYIHRETFSAVNKFRNDICERRKRMLEEQLNLYHSFGIYECDDKIRNLNGKLLFMSLYSFFQTDCKLSSLEKKREINNIINDSVFECAQEYMDLNNNIYYSIMTFLLRYKMYGFFFIILKLKYKTTKSIRNITKYLIGKYRLKNIF